MTNPTTALTRTLCLALLVVIFGTRDVSAQFEWPEKAENLEVLPKTISSQELREIMVGFAGALGVRCHHCHDDANGRRLDQMDFASDAKPAKETTRLMLRMVNAINETHLADLNTPGNAAIKVTCVTCHHGQRKPQLLQDVLMTVIDMEGIQAGIDAYRSLREQYYGGFQYDFGERTLANLGFSLMGEGKADEAEAIFRLNIEMNPASSIAYNSLAELYLQKDDKERAMAFFQQALILDPDNRNALEKIKGMQE